MANYNTYILFIVSILTKLKCVASSTLFVSVDTVMCPLFAGSIAIIALSCVALVKLTTVPSLVVE